MANPIFDRYLPKELAELGQGIEYKGKIGDLARLSAIIETELAAETEPGLSLKWRAAPVDIRLAFSWLDGQAGILAVEGRAAATITAICQRCLAVFEFDLLTPIRTILVSSSADSTAHAGLTEYEVWDLEEDAVRPIDLVEELLVMAIPFAPVHESEDACAALAGSATTAEADTVRPFADLRTRMEEVDN